MTSNTNSVADILRAFIRRQYVANSDVTLGQIRDLACGPYRFAPELFAFVQEERESILAVLYAEIGNAGETDQHGLVQVFLASTQEYIYRNNQFIHITPEQQRELAGVYLAYLGDLIDVLSSASAMGQIAPRFQAAQDAHLQRLRTFILQLARSHGEVGESLIDSPVVCEEYSAQLQLRVLGIAGRRLSEPVLDIGCGKQGLLVRYLRKAGLEAFGVDRVAVPAAGLVCADWLQLRFRAGAWGTIISHMAFSNHFIFHHMCKEGRPEDYARKYMEILAALKPGGALHYAPALPFIERLLPAASYYVLRQPVPVPAQRAGALYNAVLGGDAFSATSITRKR